MNPLSSLFRTQKKNICFSMSSRVAILLSLLVCLWSEMLLGQPQLFPWSKNHKQQEMESMSMPSPYRLADEETCKPPTKTTRTATSSSAPIVDINATKQLALGGYEKISKGSGVIPQAGPLLMILSQVQTRNLALTGSVAEIGVHHGRFTSFLFVTARNDEALVVADLFEELQDLNVDHSGSGNKQKFLQGMQTYGLQEKDLHTVFTGSSMDIPFDWSEQAGFAPFRLISIDGGHTALLAFNDLQIAFCNLSPGGIVILDDFFHGAWPGVTEAFFRFIHQKPRPLAHIEVFPFLACKSKLFVTNNRQAYDLYYNGLLDAAPDLVRPFAHEKARGSVKYEMSGFPYLMCRSQIGVEQVHELWASLAF